MKGHLSIRSLLGIRAVFGLCLLAFTMLLALNASCQAANLVPDPSFENGTANWVLGDTASSIDSTVALTGSKSLKLRNDASKVNHNAGQYGIGGVQAGTEYTYSVWVKGNNVQGIGGGGKPLAVLRWKDSSNTRIEKEMYMWAPYGTYNWTQMKINLQAPPNAAKIDVSFRSWWDCTTGTTNWDDIVLEPRDLSYRGDPAGTYQAENATTLYGGSKASTENNYTGTGYFETTASNPYIEWNNVDGGANGGVRLLSFRYTQEGVRKDWDVYINGAKQRSAKPFATGRISSWASTDFEVTLKPGNNTVRVNLLNVAFPFLIDKMDVFLKGTSTPTAATPIITPNGGSFSGSVAVSLSTTTSGAAIYYTTNGETPTAGSTRYTAPFTLTGSATVKAIAVATGFNNSAVASATFTESSVPTAATPTISPNGGTFNNPVQVSLSTTTSGARIYYTTNGSTPGTGSTQYAAPFTLTGSATVKAIAVAAGYNNSAVASAAFTVTSVPTAATPTISPNGGSFSGSVAVSLSTTTSGATIYYTTNGATPTTGSTKYTVPFTLTGSATVKAIAVAAGYTNSAVASAVFNASASIYKPYGGTLWSIPGTIEAENYDLGGEGVAYHDISAGNSGGLYRADDVDIWFSTDPAVGYYVGDCRTGEWLEYSVNVSATAQYRLDFSVCTPNTGRTMHAEIDGVNVTGSISVPNTGSWWVWRTVSALSNLSAGQHILRVAFDLGGLNLNRIVVSQTNVSPTVATPKITPNGGTFNDSVIVNLQTTTPAATIYYTTDGSTPNRNSTLYTVPFTLSETTTVKAYAVAYNFNDSAVATASFTEATNGQQPYGGTPWSIPGIIEAENYDLGGEGLAYHDTSVGNIGKIYRTDDVDIWYMSADDVGYYLGANNTGEWLEYSVDVETAGQYSLEFLVATPNTGRRVHVEIDGVNVSGSITLPNTGSFSIWQSVSAQVNLTEGLHVLRVVVDLGGFNFNRIVID